MKLEAVEKIKVVSSNIYTACEHGCNLPYNGESFEANVNHYLQDHRYTLLHIGQESMPDQEGKTYHSTIAVLSRL